MNNGRLTDFFKQIEDLSIKLDKAIDESEKQSMIISNLHSDIRELTLIIQNKDIQIQELILEIERLKNNNDKNSSNSSKPSSTNGFKKTITNNREKSTKKQGGQIGHKGTTLTSEYIEKLICNGEIDEVKVIEINKTIDNKNNKPIIRYEYDVQITRIVNKYIYYPSNDSKTIIPFSKPVTYGHNIKTIASLLGTNYMSYDGIQSFFKFITNDTINISKSTLLNWSNDLFNNLNPQIENIKTKLLNSIVLNVDESPIKIDGEQYYLHTISNGLYTLQYVTKHRSKNDIDEYGFLKQFKGIIVHDHYTLYYSYGIDNAECNVHILRYLNGVTEFTEHKWALELKELLLEMKGRKEELILENKTKMPKSELNNFRNKYLEILREGKKERLKDLDSNSYKKEELSLLNRLIKYEHNHLLFIEKFIVPFSNNRAETDLRKIKIKQKIGKFRSEDGAKNYAGIRSCISTYSKNDINIFNAIKSAFTKNPIIV